MSLNALKYRLAQRWLEGIPAFSKALVDTGKRYDGHPVFLIRYRDGVDSTDVLVFRRTPVNSEVSVLGFVPDGAFLDS